MTAARGVEASFASRGKGLGAVVFRIEEPAGDAAPSHAVLFPDGYVEFVVVTEGGRAAGSLPGGMERMYAERHHPIKFIDNEATAACYWDRAAFHFPGGGRHGA